MESEIIEYKKHNPIQYSNKVEYGAPQKPYPNIRIRFFVTYLSGIELRSKLKVCPLARRHNCALVLFGINPKQQVIQVASPLPTKSLQANL